MAAASKLTPPTEATLKDPQDGTLASQPLARRGTVDKTLIAAFNMPGSFRSAP